MELTRRVVLKPLQLPKISWTWIPLTLLVGLLILILAYPLALLFVKSFVISRPGQPTVWAVNGWVEAFTDVNLAIAIGNTFYLAFVRVIITSVLAIFFAWVVTRTDTPLKGFIEVALWLGLREEEEGFALLEGDRGGAQRVAGRGGAQSDGDGSA